MSHQLTRARPPTVWLQRSLPCAVALALGVAVAIHPIATGAAVAGMSAVVTLLLLRRHLVQGFVAALALLLAGYAFLDRGFAHIGVAPVYVGEIVLAFGLLALVTTRRSNAISRARQTVQWLVIAFMAWGALRTIPFVPVDGVDALRDAVLWIYAAFALLVLRMLDRSAAERAIPLYRKLIPYFLVWLPIGVLAMQVALLPPVPGGNVPIINLKLGDAGVHLAGIGAFVILGLHGRRSVAATVFQTAAFLVSLGLVASVNRGGLLAASTTALALTAAKPTRMWLVGASTAALLVAAAVVIDPLAGSGLDDGRSKSIGQITRNISSVFSDTGADLEGTKAFRLEWWSAIVDYTIFGPHFWMGKGFGVNLGVDDGFPTSPDDPARAPHNSHLTVLARMGVPGLVLWGALLAAFAGVVLAALFRARMAGEERRWRVLAWVAIYWLAMLVNMSFDPYLDGPMGGIPFWSIVGFGVAVASREDLFRSAVRIGSSSSDRAKP